MTEQFTEIFCKKLSGELSGALVHKNKDLNVICGTYTHTHKPSCDNTHLKYRDTEAGSRERWLSRSSMTCYGQGPANVTLHLNRHEGIW